MLGAWVGYSEPVFGDIEAWGKYGFQNLQYNKAHNTTPPPTENFIQKIYKKESKITTKKFVKHKRRQ